MIYVEALRLILWSNERRGGGACGISEEEEKQAQVLMGKLVTKNRLEDLRLDDGILKLS